MTLQYPGIHKATFEASLLKPDQDATAISKEEIARFHQLLDALTQRCTPANIEV